MIQGIQDLNQVSQEGEDNMGFVTKGFDLFYKRMITGSAYTSIPYRGYLPEFWYTESIGGYPQVSSSFLNFPFDYAGGEYATTRDVDFNAPYRALPWGSPACDLLWNVTVPSWSYTDETRAEGNPVFNITYRTWQVNLHTSKSFFSESYAVDAVGVKDYNVTSSWLITDTKLVSVNKSASFTYIHEVDPDGNPSPLDYQAYPSYIGAEYGAEYTPGAPETSDLVAYDITYPTTADNSTSSYDGQYFDQGGGAGITRKSVSQSLVTMSVHYAGNSATAATNLTKALKARRLYFPTPYSGSGTPQGTDYWFKLLTGYNISDIFTENGGIYNVQLTLKRSPTADDFYPDNNTYLSVFIHNVSPRVKITAASRIAGSDGWYPPDNNIVKIGNAYNGGPAMSFYDIQTGYQVEKFNFNVIQYGYPAQLCIEASGSLADNAFFGIIVDDIQICKVGVTTDPRFIKPTTIGAGIITNPAAPTE